MTFARDPTGSSPRMGSNMEKCLCYQIGTLAMHKRIYEDAAHHHLPVNGKHLSNQILILVSQLPAVCTPITITTLDLVGELEFHIHPPWTRLTAAV